MNVTAIELRQSDDGTVELRFETDDGWRRIERVLKGRISIHLMNEAKLQRAERIDNGG